MRTASTDLALFDAQQRAARGVRHVAGVDEVGRGCLAGPVVAAAVILRPEQLLPGVDDSKKLSREQRATQAQAVHAAALAIGWSFVGPRVIDAINIRAASLLAMRRAVRRAATGLRHRHDPAAPDGVLVLVDGVDVVPGLDLPQQAVVSGDGTSLAIAAASIIAKTIRDRLMTRLGADWPRYGFEHHKGYGTEEHLRALALHGPCPWHRYTFSPIAQSDLFAPLGSPL